MCGIVGYTGKLQAAEVLLEGLSRLEYRGYDSAGLAVRNGSEPAVVVKAAGKLRNLYEKTEGGKILPGTCGIGHTRWATHGNPTVTNAHPLVSGNCAASGSGPVESEVVGVHNGIIENYTELKDKLLQHGYVFYSETDTEVVVKLVDYYYRKYGFGPIDAINRTMVRVRGSYALALMFTDYPGEIFAARKDSPLIVGRKDDSVFVASDVPAILKHTRTVYYMENLMSARFSPGSIRFYNLNGDEVPLSPSEIAWDAEAAEKGGYEHFMLKEIHEQPAAVKNTLGTLVRDGRIVLDGTGMTDEMLSSFSRIYIVACGSARHVGEAAQYIIEDLAGIPVRVEAASEFRYRSVPLSEDTLVMLISQSGETADTLAALRKARQACSKTLAVVNVLGSSIAREADHVLYTLAGPEIAVATTKAYSAQLAAVYAFAVHLAYVRGKTGIEEYGRYISEMEALPEKIGMILGQTERLQWLSSRLTNSHDIFFIGRGLDYAASLEGSLKMKEISYIHSEPYPAGELKHGTISLVEDRVPVIGVLTQGETCEKTLSNMMECRSRGAYLIGIVSEGAPIPQGALDFIFRIPAADEHFSVSLSVIPMQLLAYYTSVNRGLDVDKPRNLAKSVTVE